jgi:hypothetical protein
MSHVIDRAAWSPEERDEFEQLLGEVVDASRDTTARLNLMDELVSDAIQAHRPWASEVARSARREGYAREIKRHQDRQRVSVAYDGRVLSVPAVQARRVVDADGAVAYQRELIELWSWDELWEKRGEALKAAQTYSDKVAHYDRLLALRELSPTSTTPAEAAEALGVDLGEWLGRAA